MTYALAASYVAKAVPELASRMPHTRGDPDFKPQTTFDGSAATEVLGVKYTSLEETMARFGRQMAKLSAASA